MKQSDIADQARSAVTMAKMRENAARGPGQPDHPHVIWHGQWTEDIRGPGVGADRNHTDWRNHGRLETLCAAAIARRMRVDDDAQAMRLWPGGAGLMRALLLTLRPEQDEPPAEPEHLPRRLRSMKEQRGRCGCGARR